VGSISSGAVMFRYRNGWLRSFLGIAGYVSGFDKLISGVALAKGMVEVIRL